jgi:zinc transporter ZupT
VYFLVFCVISEQILAVALATAELAVEAPFLAVRTNRRVEMLYTLAVILLIAWLLGVVGTYTIGAFVHVLLVIAIVLFLVGLISGRETLV